MALLDDAKKNMANIFGPANVKEIEILAQKIDPQQEPEKFIEHCIQMVSGMLGLNLARKKFQSLIDQYHLDIK